jgi:branched-chain amino acid transport system permease protein
MFLQQCLNGVMLGSIYALIAIGYNLVLGILNMLNLAHGEVFMIGAFIGLALALQGLPLYAVFPIAVICAGVLGIVVERLCFAPLKKAHLLAPLVSTIALGMVLQNAATNIWGSYARVFPRQYLQGETFHIGPLIISTTQIAILVMAIILMVAVHAFIQRTKIGLAMRAVAEEPTNSSLMGVNNKTIIIWTFFVSSALAGAAGVLVFMVFGQLSPFTGGKLGLLAMVAMVIGGMGSMKGAMIGGLLLGVVQVMNSAYFMGSMTDIILFGVMLLFIVFKPQGLFGTA